MAEETVSGTCVVRQGASRRPLKVLVLDPSMSALPITASQRGPERTHAAAHAWREGLCVSRTAHPHEHTRVPLIDHPRPAPPSCCHLPLLPHRCCHTASATWVRLGRYYADDATLLLPRHCHHTVMLTLPRRCYRAADATLLPLPHCRCGHTAAVRGQRKGVSGRGQWKGRVRAEVLRRGYWNAKRVRCARDAQTLTACRPGESSEIREGHACQKGLKMKGFKRRRKALEKKGERMWDAKGVRAEK